MRIDWQIAPSSHWEAEAVLFFEYEDSTEPLPGFQRWLEQEGSWLSGSMALEDFQGKSQQVGVFYSPPDRGISRVVCVGLGPAQGFEPDKLRSGMACALRKCRELKLGNVALPLSAFEGLTMNPAVALEEALVGSMTGLHQFSGLKTRDVEESIHPEALILLSETQPEEPIRWTVSFAEALASGICFTRDLVDAPANQVTPAFLLKTAAELAQSHGFRLEVIDREKAESLGMGAFSAVAQGSREPAYMIVLEHSPPGTENDPPLVLVGKGITFDTGGISLKPSDKLDAMKRDMAGAAAVLGVFRVLGDLEMGKRVVGIMPCTENMPGGKAYKPGDVVRSMSGLTIEVISTDAEGRMVLCDALTYAARMAPAAVIDIATLTGACVVALGKQVAGVMGNRESFVKSIQEIGWQVGERLWPLPLWDFYFESLKSDVADFRNIGDRSAGSIIGGIFLKQFVPEEIPWAHLDIAGTAWSEKDPKGATGFGVRTMVELIRRWPNVAVD
jgi:leucyl aminopeptidase